MLRAQTTAETAAKLDEPPAQAGPEPRGSRSLFDAEKTDYVDVPVYRREDLAPGMEIAGPALIIEDQTTTIVTGQFDVRVNAINYIVMKRRENG